MMLTPLLLNKTYAYSGNMLANIFTLRWFIGAYICLYVFSPVLNAFLNNVSQKCQGVFIVIFYVFSTIFGWILKSHKFNEGMSMLSLAGLYLVGGYIKRHKLKMLQFNLIVDLGIYLFLGVALVLVSILAYSFNTTKSIYSYTNPLVIVQSVYLFLFFKKLNVKKSCAVNLIAASAFSVYLFHTDICSRALWEQMCSIVNSYGSVPSLFIVILFFAALFLVCVVLDYVGGVIFDYIIRLGKQICTAFLSRVD